MSGLVGDYGSDSDDADAAPFGTPSMSARGRFPGKMSMAQSLNSGNSATTAMDGPAAASDGSVVSDKSGAFSDLGASLSTTGEMVAVA